MRFYFLTYLHYLHLQYKTTYILFIHIHNMLLLWRLGACHQSFFWSACRLVPSQRSIGEILFLLYQQLPFFLFVELQGRNITLLFLHNPESKKNKLEYVSIRNWLISRELDLVYVTWHLFHENLTWCVVVCRDLSKLGLMHCHESYVYHK